MEQTYNLIIQFVLEERDKLEAAESNYFALVFGEVAKYHNYLSIIWPRYHAISTIYIQGTKQKWGKIKSQSPGVRQVTPEEIEESKLTLKYQEQLHLELESIFIFTNILLDRTAAATQYYFGLGVHPEPWGSFGTMKEHFAGYCQNKGLPIPSEELMEAMEWLYKHVSEFRHSAVAHKHEEDYYVRLSFGTGWDSEDDEGYINAMLMYPKSQERPLTSIKPKQILSNLNKFIELWLAYLRTNSDKRNLSPIV